MIIIWGRFALSSLGEVGVKTSVAGFSLVALGTIIMTAVCILAMPMRMFRVSWILPFYAIIALGALSGFLNGQYVELVSFVVTWCYFLACALLLFRAYGLHDFRVVVGCLLSVFSLPLAGQALSFALRAPKVGPDGSFSYIGVYGHEAVFALVLMGALFLVAIYPWQRRRDVLGVLLLMVASFLIANYRTMIIAALPLITVIVIQATQPKRHALRKFAVIALVLLLVAPEVVPRLVGDRFDEIGTLTSSSSELIKPPEEYTAREKDILSARLYIWASHLYGTTRASPVQLLIGHGPDVRAPDLTVHAHNEFLRILFEFGFVGLCLWFGVFAFQVSLVLRARECPARLPVLAGYASVFLGSLGTAFFNRPEGMIFVALLCSVTWFIANRDRVQGNGTPQR
ncbi:O-antigen ligase family protein [Shimia sediminis]|uniref:O-antigen ligase family protein n=1 Tax=Shimia sediminis TaxID=2497945 RepID=UPI000F8C8875|nr:O-antigen ligase family protein [Shimia sediminis]